MDFTKVTETVKSLAGMGLGAPIVIVMILSMVVLPLPAFLLDLFLQGTTKTH